MKKILALLLATSSVVAFADDMSTPAANASLTPAASSPAANAYSSEGASSITNNLYVGLGAGAAWNNAAYPAASFRADMGYNYTDNWAVEVGTLGVTQSGSGLNQSMQFYDLSVKGTLPLGDMIALFAQVGGAYASPGSIGSPTASGLTVGQLQAGWDFFSAAGVQVNVTKQVSLNLTDYFYYGAPNPQGNTDVVLAGIKYNF